MGWPGMSLPGPVGVTPASIGDIRLWWRPVPGDRLKGGMGRQVRPWGVLRLAEGGMVAMRRIQRNWAVAVIVAVVCGVVVLNPPMSRSATPEELVTMLVTPQDLGGSWGVADDVPVAGPHVMTEEDLAGFPGWDQFLCYGGTVGGGSAYLEFAESTLLTALTQVELSRAGDFPSVFLEEYLVSGHPVVLSAAVVGPADCWSLVDEPLLLPDGLGDEAAGYRPLAEGDPTGEYGEWRLALVRIGDVLMFMAAYEWAPSGDSDRSFSDELFIDAVATAAGKLA